MSGNKKQKDQDKQKKKDVNKREYQPQKKLQKNLSDNDDGIFGPPKKKFTPDSDDYSQSSPGKNKNIVNKRNKTDTKQIKNSKNNPKNTFKPNNKQNKSKKYESNDDNEEEDDEEINNLFVQPKTKKVQQNKNNKNKRNLSENKISKKNSTVTYNDSDSEEDDNDFFTSKDKIASSDDFNDDFQEKNKKPLNKRNKNEKNTNREIHKPNNKQNKSKKYESNDDNEEEDDEEINNLFVQLKTKKVQQNKNNKNKRNLSENKISKKNSTVTYNDSDFEEDDNDFFTSKDKIASSDDFNDDFQEKNKKPLNKPNKKVKNKQKFESDADDNDEEEINSLFANPKKVQNEKKQNKNRDKNINDDDIESKDIKQNKIVKNKSNTNQIKNKKENDRKNLKINKINDDENDDNHFFAYRNEEENDSDEETAKKSNKKKANQIKKQNNKKDSNKAKYYIVDDVDDYYEEEDKNNENHFFAYKKGKINDSEKEINNKPNKRHENKKPNTYQTKYNIVDDVDDYYEEEDKNNENHFFAYKKGKINDSEEDIDNKQIKGKSNKIPQNKKTNPSQIIKYDNNSESKPKNPTREKHIKLLMKKTSKPKYIIEQIYDIKKNYSKSYKILTEKTDKELNAYIKSKQPKIRNNIQESISFTTYIELDMHGSDPRISRSLDWIPIIRDALFDALDSKVDIVSFIPGKGLHSDPTKGPVLLPLVLLTTKRLGFTSKLNPQNTGVVICDVSSYNRNNEINENEENTHKLLRSFGVYDIIIDTNNYKDLSDDDDDEEEEDEDINYKQAQGKRKAFLAVKRAFPKMPKICIDIIIERRNPKEAVRFAKLFEKYLRVDDPRDITNKKKNKKNKNRKTRLELLESAEKSEAHAKMIKNMKRVEYFEKLFRFDREIIQRVVDENPKKSKAEHVLDRICDEIKEDFYDTFSDIVIETQGISVDSILDTMKEENYDLEKIINAMNGKSMTGVKKALGVMNVKNKITTNRDDGTPKFVPKIEVDLTNCGAEKAKRSISRILNYLGNQTFSEMVLQFADIKNSNGRCKLSQIEPFMMDTAHENGYNLKKHNEKNNRFKFFIINDNEDDENDEEDEFDFNKTFYTSFRKFNF